MNGSRTAEDQGGREPQHGRQRSPRQIHHHHDWGGANRWAGRSNGAALGGRSHVIEQRDRADAGSQAMPRKSRVAALDGRARLGADDRHQPQARCMAEDD